MVMNIIVSYGMILGILMGSCLDVYPKKLIYNAAMGLNSLVAGVIYEDEWVCPPTGSELFVHIQAAICGTIFPLLCF